MFIHYNMQVITYIYTCIMLQWNQKKKCSVPLSPRPITVKFYPLKNNLTFHDEITEITITPIYIKTTPILFHPHIRLNANIGKPTSKCIPTNGKWGKQIENINFVLRLYYGPATPFYTVKINCL